MISFLPFLGICAFDVQSAFSHAITRKCRVFAAMLWYSIALCIRRTESAVITPPNLQTWLREKDSTRR